MLFCDNFLGLSTVKQRHKRQHGCGYMLQIDLYGSPCTPEASDTGFYGDVLSVLLRG